MTDSLQTTTLKTIVRRTIVAYRWTVYTSFAFILAGFVIVIATGHEVSSEMGAPSELMQRMLDLHPSGFFGVGIGIMILAPIAMLADAALTFLRSGDKRYAMITGLVALILSISILVSFLKG